MLQQFLERQKHVSISMENTVTLALLQKRLAAPIGNVGQNNHLAFFVGKIRCARISKGEVYLADFTPDEQFDSTENAMLIYDGRHTDGDKVIDLSGKGNHGVWEQL